MLGDDSPHQLLSMTDWWAMRMEHNVSESQSTETALLLLDAASQLHQKVRALILIRWAVVLLLAASSFVAIFVPKSAGLVAVFGLLGAVLSNVVLVRRINAQSRQAALVQERFDCEVLGLDWPSTTYEDVPDEKLKALARKARRKASSNPREPWYPEAADTRQWPYNAMQCQRANLSWDIGLRRKWATILFSAAAVWVGIGVAWSVVAHWPIETLAISWLSPSLAAVMLALTEALGNRDVAAAKSSLYKGLTQEMSLSANSDMTPSDDVRQAAALYARAVQDQILRLRSEHTRVPQFLYSYLRDNYEADMRESAEGAR